MLTVLSVTLFVCCGVGVELVRKALRIPCYTIAANAGVDADDVVTRVMREKDDIGYDALHDKYVDMMKTGIIDPTKVRTSYCTLKAQYDLIHVENAIKS